MLHRQMEMVQVNVAALTHLTRLLLPGMIERRRGGILNVASTAGFQAGPFMAVYYATKAYVISFSEALADELAGSGREASPAFARGRQRPSSPRRPRWATRCCSDCKP